MVKKGYFETKTSGNQKLENVRERFNSLTGTPHGTRFDISRLARSIGKYDWFMSYKFANFLRSDPPEEFTSTVVYAKYQTYCYVIKKINSNGRYRVSLP
jgi:hypothetical protein